MKRFAALVSAVALAAVSCTSEQDPGSDDGPTTQGQQSVLQDFTGDKLCELLPVELVEQKLKVRVRKTEGSERGRAPVVREPYFLARECEYDTEGFPALYTDINTRWDAEKSDQELLDAVFTFPGEGEPTGEYQRLPDLGVLAGYGGDPALGKADVAGEKLGVVLKAGDERFVLTLWTIGRSELKQLRPLAEELVGNLDAELK